MKDRLPAELCQEDLNSWDALDFTTPDTGLAKIEDGKDSSADHTLASVDGQAVQIQPKPKSAPIKRRSDAGWWIDSFLDAFKELGTVRGAAEAVGIESTVVRKWLKNDVAFKERYTDALDDFTDLKEKQAWAMAERNPTMIIFMLKGLRPEKYKDYGSSLTVNNQNVDKIVVDLIPLDPPKT